MRTGNRDFIYLYCVTKAKPNHADLKNSGINVYPIYSQGACAIVSRVSSNEFSEESLPKRLNDMQWLKQKVLHHERVIEEVMRDTPVIPFKFATVFHAEKNVIQLLKENRVRFKELINSIETKEEWGLKIYCDLEKFKEILQEQDETIKAKDQEISSVSNGKAYFLKKKKADFINRVLYEKTADYMEDCFDRLEKISADAKINKLLPPQAIQRKESMVFNAAFLIKKKRIEGFNQILEYLKTTYCGKGLIFDLTGPWPPYNFCSLTKEECKNG